MCLLYQERAASSDQTASELTGSHVDVGVAAFEATKLDVMALMYDATRQSIRFDALCEFVESRLEVEGRGTSRDRGEIEGVRRDVRRHAFVLGLEQLRKRGRCL